MAFFDAVIEEMSFAIQRIQTDRGRDFFRHKISGTASGVGNEGRHIRLASPRLNGKVEGQSKQDTLHENL